MSLLQSLRRRVDRALHRLMPDRPTGHDNRQHDAYWNSYCNERPTASGCKLYDD